ncbi:MAG: ATP-binding protein [Ancalomicrobiaceae bacterium]|nr:ATP-binding protein [Ancalomicrobiaceae bacterium]
MPAIAVLALILGLGAFELSQHRGIDALIERGRQRLDLYEASLEREIDKYAFFPATLGLEHDVVDLILNANAARVAAVNRYLEQLNQRAGSLSIYVLDARGHVIATSNWNRPDSFLGETLTYRSYFGDAIAGRNGRFFGIGTTKGEPGYYLSSPILIDGKPQGVAVVKVSLEQLEQSWTTVEAPVFVADENGVVILASVSSWKFTAVRPLSEAVRRDLAHSLHYNARPLPPLGLSTEQSLDGRHAELVALVRPHTEAAPVFPVSGRFVAQTEPLIGNGWTLTVLSPYGDVAATAWTHAALAAVGGAFLAILGVAWTQRRQRILERLKAREALQRAHDELELKVEERTRTLKAAQDELIHAGKLAVIGQMSAGLAHELNQPLAALQTLSDNTVIFLERGQMADATSNLALIGELVTHMGALTNQLKSFARKSSGELRPVPVARAIDNALLILDRRLSRGGVKPGVAVEPADVAVLADANRLEQILVNLIANALDALDGFVGPRLVVSAERLGDRIHIAVIDNGPGLSDDARARLFEPFFTTKEKGGGLGLGLAISAGIARDFGGSLTAADGQLGGTTFILDLAAAELQEA